jgi:hypothetical protein
VDYVSKWVEAVATKINDHKVVVKFIQVNIFSWFGMPRRLQLTELGEICNDAYDSACIYKEKIKAFHD